MNSIPHIIFNSDYTLPIILGAILVFVWVWMFWLPFRCGNCLKFHTIRSTGASVAGEYIIHDAWCDNCKTKFKVDDAGYLVTDAGHIFRRAVPE